MPGEWSVFNDRFARLVAAPPAPRIAGRLVQSISWGKPAPEAPLAL